MGEALRAAGRFAPALVGAQALVLVLVWGAVLVPLLVSVAGFAGGLPLLGGVAIPLTLIGVALAVHLYVSFALVVPAVVLERAGPLQALARSHRLVRGRWWPVLGTLIVTGIVVGLVGVALGAIPSAIASFFPLETLGQVLTSLANVLVVLIRIPVNALVVLMIYFDARIRSEGFDLELRAG